MNCLEYFSLDNNIEEFKKIDFLPHLNVLIIINSF